MNSIKRAAAAVLLAVMCFQTAHASCTEVSDWREKMQAEKIAFITTELDLSPSEAEKFWPVYNMIEKARKDSFDEIIKAYVALKKAVEAGQPDSELETLLKAYLEAQKIQAEAEGKASEKLSKVLPTSKVAKLYVVEEKFRRQQINKLGGPHPQPRKPQAQR